VSRLIALLFALLGLAACAHDIGERRADGSCPLIRLAQGSIETRGNMQFVPVEINGQPVTLLLDTGAERTLLTESAVQRLQLPRDLQHATRTFGIGSPTASWDAVLPNGLTLGGTHFPVDRVTVGQFGINQVAGNDADGLLGADILLAFDIDLDLRDQTIALYRARRDCPEAGPPWSEPYVAVDGITTKRDRLMLPFTLDGVSGLAVLDTGAQLSSVSQRMFERLGLAEADLVSDRTIMAHGAAPEQVPVRIHHFRELRVGPAVMQAPALPVVPMTSSMGDALVGGDFLRGRRVWLSFATQRVYVTPLETGPWIAATHAGEK
jgi:predicted aspartyl protease